MYICAYIPNLHTHKHTPTHSTHRDRNLYESTYSCRVFVFAARRIGNFGYFGGHGRVACAVFEYVSFEIVPLQFAWHLCASFCPAHAHTHSPSHAMAAHQHDVFVMPCRNLIFKAAPKRCHSKYAANTHGIPKRILRLNSPRVEEGESGKTLTPMANRQHGA